MGQFYFMPTKINNAITKPMKTKTVFLATAILFISFLSATLIIIHPAYARKAGTIYVTRITNGFPCSGTCNPNEDLLPQGSEAFCPHQCSTNWSQSCPVVGNYTNYVRQCWLTANCGCDIATKCPGTSQCVKLNVSDWNIGSCQYSCCVAGEEWTKTTCIKCTEEVSADGKSAVPQNECVYKNKCGDPCPKTCPPQKCEIIDATKTGKGIGYNCVPDALAKSSSNLASASGSTVQIASAPPAQALNYCECKQKVSDGKYFWCQGGCCPAAANKYCCGGSTDHAVCCNLNPKQECTPSVMAGTNYCNNSTCTPDRPKLCPGKNFSACCKQDEECGLFSWGVAYCKDPSCTPTSSGYCAPGLCCTGLETCTPSKGIYKCIPNSCPTGQVLCKGTGKFEPISVCCKSCNLNMPNGYPSCTK